MKRFNLINLEPSQSCSGEWVQHADGSLFPQSSALDLSQAIGLQRSGKKEWLQKSFAERKEIFLNPARNLLHEKEKEILSIESTSSFLSLEAAKSLSLHFALKQIDRAESSFQANFIPHGTMACILPKQLTLRAFFEIFFFAIYSGNALVIKLPSDNFLASEWIKNFVVQLNLPAGLVQIFYASGQGDFTDSLIGHPAIRSLIYFGKQEHFSSIIEKSSARQKLLSLNSFGKNAALFLDTPPETEKAKMAFANLLSSLIEGAGSLPWSIQRVFVLESQKEEFLKNLQENAFLFEQNSNNQELLMRIKKQQELKSWERHLIENDAKVLKFDSPFLSSLLPIGIDLNMCDPLHQDFLFFPHLNLSFIKYPHEMIKWANTGYLAMNHMIFANDPIRARSLAEKLETSLVSINSWCLEFLKENSIKGSKFSQAGLLPSAIELYGLGDKIIL